MPIRALPHQEAFAAEDYVEVLDYEKAAAIVEKSRRYVIGICSCRHEKQHVGEKQCDNPLESCLSFDTAADYLVRHQMGREVSKEEMLAAIARARDLGLVLNADNVKQRVSFICTCCGCCCNVLLGISKFGYPNTVVTSNYIAARDEDECIECGECIEACPINAIEAVNGGPPEIDEALCIGCGVCALACDSDALKLVERPQRVLHPEDTFEKIVLQCLERGTLQNQMFPNPQSLGHSFMRAFVGAFLKLPPVKKALMGDTLRSRFLTAMRGK
jgi:Pyruvate/2-oxoacid:ferredoxin oxidoreductase delta subunit